MRSESFATFLLISTILAQVLMPHSDKRTHQRQDELPITYDLAVETGHNHVIFNHVVVSLKPMEDYDIIMGKHLENLSFDPRGKSVFYKLEELPGYSAAFISSEIDEIRRDVRNVEIVEYDIAYYLHSNADNVEESSSRLLKGQDTSQPATILSTTGRLITRMANTVYAKVTPVNFSNLIMITTSGRGSAVQNGYPHVAGAGRDVDAYVLDSGIGNHHDFQDRLRRIYRWSRSHYTNTAWENNAGHGTNVAGVIGGSTTGVAPNVTLVDVKISDEEGRLSWTLRGLNDAIGQHKRLRGSQRSSLKGAVINISQGMLIAPSALTDPLMQQRTAYGRLCQRAYDAGIPVVTAAENDGDRGPMVPCAFPSTVCVAGLDITYKKFGNYSYGNYLNITGPGEWVKTLQWDSDQSIGPESGTSMAAAHITGILAIFIFWEPRRNDTALLLKRLYQNERTAGDWREDFPKTPTIGLGNTGILNPRRDVEDPYIT